MPYFMVSCGSEGELDSLLAIGLGGMLGTVVLEKQFWDSKQEIQPVSFWAEINLLILSWVDDAEAETPVILPTPD